MSRRSLGVVRNAITEAAPGFYGAGSKLLSQSRDNGFERVGITRVVVAVEVFDELARRNDPPLMMKQIGDETKLERRQCDRDTVDGEPHLPRVETEGPGFDHGGTMPGRAPDEGAGPRNQLLHSEWLRQIVVSARIDALDAFSPSSACGQ